MTRARIAAAVLLAAVPAAAAPPPPGWEHRGALETCGSDPPPTPAMTEIEAIARPVKPPLSGRLRLAWAVKLTPRGGGGFGRVVGLAYDRRLGLIAATDRKAWLSIPLDRIRAGGTVAVAAAPMRGAPGVPQLMSQSLLDSVLVGVGEPQRVVRYNFYFCGLAAIPTPNLKVPEGRRLDAIGALPAWLDGDNLLFVGSAGGRPAQGADVLKTAEPPLAFDTPFVPAMPGACLLAAASLDAAEGCDAVALWRPDQRPDQRLLQAFCSPRFETAPVAAHGDVAWRIQRRSAPHRDHPILARVGLAATLITDGPGDRSTASLILGAQDADGGLTLVGLTAPAADYQDRGPGAPVGR